MRVARETYVLLARFRDDTVKSKRGASGSSFAFYTDASELVLGRSFVLMMMTLGSAVLAMMAVMRRRLVGCLRLGGGCSFLRSRLHA